VEPVEHAGAEKSLPRSLRIFGRCELHQDVHLAWVLDVPEDAPSLSRFPCARPILVEHRFPGIEVADVDAGQHVWHLFLPFMTLVVTLLVAGTMAASDVPVP